jgi:serine/threonine protein kinase/ActR/RegA family two-component response regulator
MEDQLSDTIYDIYDDDLEESPLALIVEDDTTNQNFLIENLMKKGLECMVAEAASEAEKMYLDLKAQNRSVDVVFLDIYLKDDSLGMQFLRKAREQGWLERAIIIVMSAAEEVEVIAECHRLKCTNFIRKPIKKNQFANEIFRITSYLYKIKCPLPKYKIEKTLGMGASGVVELIRNKETNELFAMKVIKLDPNNRNSGELEYNILLKCPFILELIEYKISEENLYLVLEYAEYGTLSHCINENVNNKTKFDVDTILDWMTELLLGLFEIHDKSLIHRDIKSDNLFICKNHVLKFGDLGIAWIGKKNIAINVCDTFHYRAPEIFHWKEYGNGVDIWSAGVVLYELIMQKVPFEGYSTEIISKLDVMNYDPLPEDTDKRLQKLLSYTLVYNSKERLSAIEILKKDFMRERVEKLFKSKIIDDMDLYNKVMEKINSKPKMPRIIEMNKDITRTEGDEKIKNYYNTFKTAMKLDTTSAKTTYKAGLLSNKFDNVVNGSDIRMLVDDNDMDMSEIEDAIEKKFLVNVLASNSTELDDNGYYQIKVLENPTIDNSIIFPVEQGAIDLIVSDPVGLSALCLNQVNNLKKKLDNGMNDDEVDIEKLKIDVFSSEEFLEFAYNIKKLKYLRMDKYSKEQKLATILNIYQTMYIHLYLKNMFSAASSIAASGIINMFKQVFKKGNSQNNITYEIAGQSLSLYEMKHIVIRRNKKPLDQYFRLVYDSDPRVSFIDEKDLLKLHMICLDPPTSENYICLSSSIVVFSEKTVFDQLNEYCKDFINKNVVKEHNILSVPMFLKNYLADFGGNEQDLMKQLLKYHNDPTLKPTIVTRLLSTKDLTINYS